MGFFKKVKQEINQLWYPQSITVGKPVTTDEVAKRIAAECTANPADTYAVLKSLGGIMSDFMASGRTVKLEGLGTFYYTATANGKGVDSPEKVSASQITGVRVRFIPESHKSSNHQVTTRTLVSSNIYWEEWGGKDSSTPSPDGDGGGEAPDPEL